MSRSNLGCIQVQLPILVGDQNPDFLKLKLIFLFCKALENKLSAGTVKEEMGSSSVSVMFKLLINFVCRSSFVNLMLFR